MKVIDYLILLSQGVHIYAQCPNRCFDNFFTLLDSLDKYVYVEHIAEEDIDKVTRLEKYFKLNIDNMLKDTPKEDKKIKRIEERESCWCPNMADGNVLTLKQAINEIIDKVNKL